MTEWFKDCTICNTGLCSKMKEHLDSGMSMRAAAKKMSEESGGEFSEATIRQRYQYYALGRVGGRNPTTRKKHPVDEALSVPVDEAILSDIRPKEWYSAINRVEDLISEYRRSGYKEVKKEALLNDIRVFYNLL